MGYNSTGGGHQCHTQGDLNVGHMPFSSQLIIQTFFSVIKVERKILTLKILWKKILKDLFCLITMCLFSLILVFNKNRSQPEEICMSILFLSDGLLKKGNMLTHL